MELLLITIYVGALIYLANLNELNGEWEQIIEWMLYGLGLLTILLGFTVGLTSLVGAFPEAAVLSASNEPGAILPDLPKINLLVGMGFSIIATGIGLFSFRVVHSQNLRQVLSQRLRFPHFKPDSSIHTVALILILCVLTYVFATFVLVGGQEGLTEELASAGLDPFNLVFTTVIYILIAFLGIGLFLRRDLRQSLSRLGLEPFRWMDIGRGTLAALLLFFFVIVAGGLWQTLVSPETFSEQTLSSDTLFSQYTESLFIGFLVALCAGVSEEILFRGALQPVFGIGLTSVFFVLLHVQYIFTPATLILLVVAFVFGYLRKRYNTNTVIMAHFVYNFIPICLAILLRMAV